MLNKKLRDWGQACRRWFTGHAHNRDDRESSGEIVNRIKRWIGKNRRILTTVGVILAALLMVWTASNPAIVGVSASTRALPIYCVQRDNKEVSLTFDAAWGNQDTEQLIEILAKYGVKATFFVVGDWVDRYPESVKALSDAGHEVMNHSNDHAHFSKLSADAIVRNINDCNDKIEGITGTRPNLFRAPYGEYDDNVVKTLTGLGMFTIQWDVDSLDWKDLSAREITKRVLDGVSPGSIVLFHNAAKHTPEALPGIIEGLLASGYSLAPVSELLLPGEYYIDHTGRQMAQ